MVVVRSSVRGPPSLSSVGLDLSHCQGDAALVTCPNKPRGTVNLGTRASGGELLTWPVRNGPRIQQREEKSLLFRKVRAITSLTRPASLAGRLFAE